MRTCPACGAAYPNRQAICARDGALLIGSRRVPRWVREPSIIVLAMVIIVAGLALVLPTSKIVKEASELDRAHHYSLGGVLRRLACTRGNGQACGELAFMYDLGRGVARDSTRAEALYLKACDAGNAGACGNLGVMYEGSGLAKDTSRASALYSREAA